MGGNQERTIQNHRQHSTQDWERTQAKEKTHKIKKMSNNNSGELICSKFNPATFLCFCTKPVERGVMYIRICIVCFVFHFRRIIELIVLEKGYEDWG